MKNHLSCKKFRLFTSLSFCLVSWLLSLPVLAQVSVSYNTAGTFSWTCPGGVTNISVELWGGGGAGGGSSSNGTAGGGGGGGAYRKILNIPVTAGTVYSNSIIVGAGGTGGTGNGAAGGNSSINMGTLYSCNGGSGGISGNNGGTGGAGGTGGTFNGGNGANGNNGSQLGGGGGGGGGILSGGNNGLLSVGALAVAGGGPGGNGANNGNNNTNGSLPASGPGGGGGGGYRKNGTTNGGNGFAGSVVITYTCNTFQLTGTSATDACTGSGSQVSLSGTSANLPVGNYTVSYNLTGANTVLGNTAVMNVVTAGTGSFSTIALNNAGLTSVTITNLAYGCSNPILSNNVGMFTVNKTPVLTSSLAPAAVCSNSLFNYTPTSDVTGTFFNWSRAVVSGISNSAASGSGAINETLVNTSISPKSPLYIYSLLANGCSNSQQVTVAVNPLPTVNSVSNQGLCAGNNSTAITFSGSIPGTVYNWTNNNTSIGLSASGAGNIPVFTATNNSSSPVVATITVTPAYTSGGSTCTGAPIIFSITVQPAAVGGSIDPVSTVVCASPNNGTLTLSGYSGNVVQWQKSTNGGTSWSNIANITALLSFTNLTANMVHYYRAVIQYGSCTVAYSSTAMVIVKSPVTVNPSGHTATPASICPGGSSVLSTGNTGYTQVPFPLEDFAQANPAGWDGMSAGNNSAKDPEEWGETNGAKSYSGTVYNSNAGGKFVITNGLINGSLESPLFSTLGMQTAVLEFYQAFVLENGANAKIELSIDGGATYNILIKDYTGPMNFANPDNGFQKVSFSLDSYLGISSLRIRFRYTGTALSSWALDDIGVQGVYEPVSYAWTPTATLTPASGLSATVTATPPVTTAYTVTTYLGNCPGGSAIKTVTVKSLPVITHSAVSPVCSGTIISPNIVFSSSLSGTTYSYSINNPGGITGIVTNSNGTISGTPVNPTAVAQTITFTATPTAGGCPGSPDVVSLVINPKITVALSGSQTICANAAATLTLTTSGPFPLDVTLSNGITYTVTGSPYNIMVNPVVPTNYTIVALGGSACASVGSFSGTAVVSIPTAGSPVGTWICGTDNDWFNPCNWGGGIVPDNSTNVTIPSSASCSPIINPNSVFAPPDKIARCKGLTINKGLSFSNGGDLYVAGNWNNNVGSAGFTANTGTVTLMGNNPQSITTITGSTEAFYSLTINNTSSSQNSVVLANKVTVSGVLSLIRGIVRSSSTNLLSITNPATTAVTGGGVSSYIWGPIARNTNSTGDYLFPVGRPGAPYTDYRPALVAPETGSLTRYQVEYLNSAPNASLNNKGGNLTELLSSEHWQIDRVSGTADAVIKLPYINPNNNGHWTDATGPCSACNVAIVTPFGPSSYWYFTNGTNFGIGFNTSLPESRHYTNNGIIYSKPMSVFGEFTFGFSYGIILPVHLIAFDGRLVNGNAKLAWSVDNTADLAGFDLEYSTDGNRFVKLSSVASIAGAVNYSFVHSALAPGSNYYRLLVKDNSGHVFYSKSVLIKYENNTAVIRGIRPTLVTSSTFVEIYAAQAMAVNATVIDASGRIVMRDKGLLCKGENSYLLNAGKLITGMYSVQIITTDGTTANLRFLKE